MGRFKRCGCVCGVSEDGRRRRPLQSWTRSSVSPAHPSRRPLTSPPFSSGVIESGRAGVTNLSLSLSTGLWRKGHGDSSAASVRCSTAERVILISLSGNVIFWSPPSQRFEPFCSPRWKVSCFTDAECVQRRGEDGRRLFPTPAWFLGPIGGDVLRGRSVLILYSHLFLVLRCRNKIGI